MKKQTDEEKLFDKEGRGRFPLRQALQQFPTVHPSRTGPQFVLTNLPVLQGDQSPVLPRVKLVGRLQKDAMGNDVRVFVPYRRKRRK